MEVDSNKRNTVDRGPSRTTWPPPWLAEAGGAATMPTFANSTGTGLTPSTLPPDLREAWEERVVIMHYDGCLPWNDAERLALADVLSNYKRQ